MASRTLLAGLIALCLAQGILHSVAAKRSQRRRRQLLVLEGPCDEPIWDSGLLEKTLPYATLVEKGSQYDMSATAPEARRFQGTVLGYITPWHRSGYETALTWRHKLTHVAPVWYQLRAKKGREGAPAPVFELVGGHEYNATWASELNRAGPGHAPKLVPRVILELAPQDMVALLQQPASGLALVLDEIEANGYDGIVLEVWSSWMGMNGLSNEDFRNGAMSFVAGLGQRLKAKGKELLMAVPPIFPASPKSIFTDRDMLAALMPHVDAWSVMTYDFSSAQEAGPNAPINWFKQNIDFSMKGMVEGATLREGMAEPQALPAEAASKLLMGLNFYGWDYDVNKKGLQAVTWPSLLKLMRTHEPQLIWDEKVAEHAFVYQEGGSTHEVWPPTPRSMYLRIQEAEKAGMGLSIWELGQGMARFMELL